MDKLDIKPYTNKELAELLHLPVNLKIESYDITNASDGRLTVVIVGVEDDT